MFHKNAAQKFQSSFTSSSTRNNFINTAGHNAVPETSNGPRLVSPDEAHRQSSTALPELIAIASRRCSSFFAEAAVLVLVFGLLDFFLQRGRMEMGWVAGALFISVALLVASVATDFTTAAGSERIPSVPYDEHE